MKLLITKTAVKQLLRIPYHQRVKLEAKIEQLAQATGSLQVKKLSGRPCWRLRVGDYRILYSIDKKNKSITILNAQHRKDAYRI